MCIVMFNDGIEIEGYTNLRKQLDKVNLSDLAHIFRRMVYPYSTTIFIAFVRLNRLAFYGYLSNRISFLHNQQISPYETRQKS